MPFPAGMPAARFQTAGVIVRNGTAQYAGTVPPRRAYVLTEEGRRKAEIKYARVRDSRPSK